MHTEEVPPRAGDVAECKPAQEHPCERGKLDGLSPRARHALTDVSRGVDEGKRKARLAKENPDQRGPRGHCNALADSKHRVVRRRHHHESEAVASTVLAGGGVCARQFANSSVSALPCSLGVLSSPQALEGPAP